MSQRTVTYGGNVYAVEDPNATPEKIKEAMAEIFPELARANVNVDTNGNITFQVPAGTKGARIAYYNGISYNIDDDSYTPEEIQKTLAEFYPELARATYVEDANRNLTFHVPAGTKGVH